ncbi:MAG TPA: 4'-phosphopantetheinyl transferase superfamily protein [Verrucomicrobiae bacterium]|nr:4'-phosphopantetheinyl transferase superfamily protein [Verrucomicrobiae bacterium]
MNSSELLWPELSATADLPPGVVRVWASPLSVTEDFRNRLLGVLSPEERLRAERFRFDRHRHRFLAGRGILRTLLGGQLQCNAADLQFALSPKGKPALGGPFENSGLHFNVAHAVDLLLVAITRLGPVGVDVEPLRELKDAGDLVKRFFSPRESERFHALRREEQPAAFFNLWTRKEAWLKATGEGIAGGLDRVEVTFEAGEPARVISIAGDVELATCWTLEALQPAVEWAGAVAIRASPRCFEHGKFSAGLQ